jgi:hypothetical protein
MHRWLAALIPLVLTAGLLAVRAADAPAPTAAPETWWSLRTIVKPLAPAVSSARFADWPRTPIDRFIQAKLLEKGLELPRPLTGARCCAGSPST